MSDKTPLPDLPRISLDGFAPPWGASEYHWGPAIFHDGVYWQDHQYHAEMLGWYYHDYLGTHIYAQVWDYAQQDDEHQRWQYVLLLHRPTRHWDGECIIRTDWAWAIVNEYPAVAGDDGEWDWRSSVPSYATVGADVDQWVTCPEVLRFLIQGD